MEKSFPPSPLLTAGCFKQGFPGLPAQLWRLVLAEGKDYQLPDGQTLPDGLAEAGRTEQSASPGHKCQRIMALIHTPQAELI